MELRNNTVIMDLDTYDRIIKERHTAQEEATRLAEAYEILMIKRYEILEHFIDEYNIRNYTLEEVTNITDNYKFGLVKAVKLLELFTANELIEYVTRKKKEYDNGTEEA